MKKITDKQTPGSPPGSVLAAVARLLRPLVRLLVHYNVTFPALSNLLKSIYVDVAEKEFPLNDKPPTDSRITLLTGVHRKDVKRFRQQADEDIEGTRTATLGALLVSRWTGQSLYLDEQGNPRPLARLAKHGHELSFEALVETVSKDIRPRVVLDEWLRLGIVHITSDDRVVLDTLSFVPEDGLDEKAHFLGRNLSDHIAACTHNLTSGADPMLERSVFYDALTEEDVADLEAYCRAQGVKLIQKINQRALALQEASKDKPDTNQRMNFGVYFYTAEDEADDGQTPDE